MRTLERKAEADQIRHLSENLMTQLAKGREWATPGVEAALQRAVAGLDSGIETASPRIQAVLRRLADELAGGVETLTPRVHEGLMRVAPKGTAPVTHPGPADTGQGTGKTLLIVAMLAAAIFGGVAAWRSFNKANTESAQTNHLDSYGSVNPDTDPLAEDRGTAI